MRQNHELTSVLGKVASYPTNSSLHDRIKAAFGHIDIPRYSLHGDDLVELVSAARQRQDVFIAKRWLTGVTYAAKKKEREREKEIRSEIRTR